MSEQNSTPDGEAAEAVEASVQQARQGETEAERAERAAALTAAAQSLFAAGSATRAEHQDEDGSAEQDAPQVSMDDILGDLPLVTVLLEEDDLAEEIDAPVEDTAADDSDDSDEEDAADDSDGDDDADDASDVQAEAPVPVATVPSFGLIFQAPDLSEVPRRRSRRATSGVTAPAPAEERVEVQESLEATQDDTAGQDEESSEDQGERRGRRRRRGGKGRRSRGGADNEAGDDSSEQNDDESADEPDDHRADPDGENDADTEGTSEGESSGSSSRRRRSRRGRRSGSSEVTAQDGAADEGEDNTEQSGEDGDQGEEGGSSTRRRRRRARSGSTDRSAKDEVSSIKGSTRLEAKRQRRREGREAGRRRTIITEAEFLARRESVERVMVVRGQADRTQIAVLEDGVAVEHYVSRSTQSTMVGNVYLGRVQNVLPSMEAAFVDIGKGRNAVLYAGEVNWDAAGLDANAPRRIENALKSGSQVLVQVTKDPIGHKGARLTSQVSLPGRYLVYVPGHSMTGISRKLPDTERTRLKKILKEVVPADAGVIVRTAAEGASEAELRADVERLTAMWERIQAKASATSTNAPTLLHGEPDMTVRVIRDVFNEDFSRLVVAGEQAWNEVKRYIDEVAPDLAPRVEKYTGTTDIFTTYRVSEAIAKAMDRKVWLPSGGSLVIDRTEAMTVIDVNTGKFTGSGGNLEETVTKNNIEAAEEIVRQLRLRDIGGIIVIDFIDMVLESNRELVVRRLLECLGRDRTKHQVAEVTSLGLVQMTRKRVGSGLIEVFSESCAHCSGRGIIVHTEPVGKGGSPAPDEPSSGGGSKRGRKGRGGNGGNGGGSASSGNGSAAEKNVLPTPNPTGPTPAQIAAAAHAAALASAGTAEESGTTAVNQAVAEQDGSAQLATVQETQVEVAPADEPQAGTPADDPQAGTPAEGQGTEQLGTDVDHAAAGEEPQVGTAPEVESPVELEVTADATAEVAVEAPVEPEPAPPTRPRRRRGRVSAPAGPPGGTAVEPSNPQD